MYTGKIKNKKVKKNISTYHAYLSMLRKAREAVSVDCICSRKYPTIRIWPSFGGMARSPVYLMMMVYVGVNKKHVL
jgi:hypothetical protein